MNQTALQTEGRKNTALTLSIVFLFSFFILGMAWLLTNPWETIGILFAYTSGLSMIILPCTLPAVFVIVPLVLGKNLQKGIAIALLFVLGLTLTLTAYGLVVGLFGKVFYLDRITFAMWLIAGVAAYIIGLHELRIVSLRFPHFGIPQKIQTWNDYIRSFVFGLLLGNAGIGCPNPAFYVLLTYIAASASMVTGSMLGFVHGIGRIIPLLAIVFLAMRGVNILPTLAEKRVKLQRLVGWTLIVFALLLLPKPLFGHVWWESSIFHEGWQRGVLLTLGERIAESREAEEILGSQNVVKPFLSFIVQSHTHAIYVPWIFIGVLANLALLLDRRRLGKSLGESVVYVVMIFAAVMFFAWLAELIPHIH